MIEDGQLASQRRGCASDAARGNAAGVLGSLAQTGGLAKQTAMARAGKLSSEEAQKQALDRIRAMRFGADGYFTVMRSDTVVLMHPIKSEMNGKNMSETKDPNGVYLFRDIAQIGKTTGKGFVEYLWPKPGAEAPQPKLSYVLNFRPWDWNFIAGLYMDDIQAEFRAALWKSLGWLLAVGALMSVVMIRVSASLHKQLGGEPALTVWPGSTLRSSTRPEAGATTLRRAVRSRSSRPRPRRTGASWSARPRKSRTCTAPRSSRARRPGCGCWSRNRRRSASSRPARSCGNSSPGSL